ncbi:MAG TPA: KamA family radical SAM protein [Propionibacteriaceae bacterium]|nr:KamA family radical SAM protein [Propionibacteriaceae bacterium]
MLREGGAPRGPKVVSHPAQLAGLPGVNIAEVERVHAVFPLRISQHYLSLIEEPGDPLWLQAVPDIRELSEGGVKDPLDEDADSPVPYLTHRSPDRVLLRVSDRCAMYCRFCTRRWKIANPDPVSPQVIENAIDYIRAHHEVRDVVVSGGDPLMLSNGELEAILSALRAIPHVEIIRIGSRVPVTMPERVTSELCDMLRRYHPLYLNTHFNHPREITPESAHACALLADAGIPLGNQSVLLKGVNDDPQVMKELVQGLLRIRVRPYYLYQMDLVRGTAHFRTSVAAGLDIIRALRGHTSGLAVPHYVIDAPGGGGKIALVPNAIVSTDDDQLTLVNYQGNQYTYPSGG